MESNSVLLKFIYAKKFMKYDNRVLKSEKGQFFIIYEEMMILKRKLLKFIGFFFLKADSWQNLYLDISEKLKKKFNRMLVELIHILYSVANCALQEFADEPEKIGVESVRYFYQLHQMQKFKDENEAFLEHILLLKELIEYFKSSVDVYFILNRSYEREVLSLATAQKVVYLIMKATSYSIELKMMFTNIHKNQINKRHLEKGILEIENFRKKINELKQRESSFHLNSEPSLHNTLVKMGWKQKQENEIDVIKANIVMEESRIKEFIKTNTTFYNTQRNSTKRIASNENSISKPRNLRKIMPKWRRALKKNSSELPL